MNIDNIRREYLAGSLSEDQLKEDPFDLFKKWFQEVIDSAIRVTGRDINVVDAARRGGDPAVLVADSSLARKELGWEPRFADLDTIVRHAWQWEQQAGEWAGK